MWQVCYFVVYLYDETLCISLWAHKPNRVSCPLCYMNFAMAIVLLHVHVCSIGHVIIYCTLHWYHIAINFIWFDLGLFLQNLGVFLSCLCLYIFNGWSEVCSLFVTFVLLERELSNEPLVKLNSQNLFFNIWNGLILYKQSAAYIFRLWATHKY